MTIFSCTASFRAHLNVLPYLYTWFNLPCICSSVSSECRADVTMPRVAGPTAIKRRNKRRESIPQTQVVILQERMNLGVVTDM